ncbi:MAG: DUF4962 domain-containing protein [Bacillota bacterium]
MISRGLAALAAIVLPGFLGSAHAACGKHSDILVRSDALLAPVRPADCATVHQTPPDFTWPPQEGRNEYTLLLTHPDGHTESRATTKNWLIWPRALAPGTYTWKVKVAGASRETSDARRFTVAPDAVAFVVPSGEEALERVKRAPRPRSWPPGVLAAIKAERARGFADLLSQVDAHMKDALPADPKTASTGEGYDDAVTESKHALAAAFAWAVTRSPSYGREAMRRLLNLASWQPRGATGYARNDMASRTIAWTLALAYDWNKEQLAEAQRHAILDAIGLRTQPMFDDVIPRVDRYPYDSHGNVSLTLTAAIAALMVGEIPEADGWLKSSISEALVWTSPWGWEDGGFGNGTAQAQWDEGSNLPAWIIFRQAVGADLAEKAWVRNYARYLAYFLPPGTPSGVFGDGQESEMNELWARIGKAYAAFAPSPLARWYARQWSGEDASRLELLLAPRVDAASAPLPAGTAPSIFLPSIGWIAMHSDLSDRARTSIYFKSSPYGSYNHSHADQNSFVVNHRGKRLAIASGYYDGYRTGHWTNWYKQTRAANAITFDGGHGQGVDGRQFAGEITRFEPHDGYDIATGHAEAAYAGALTRAQRTLVYLRPRTLVVYDSLAANTAHAWEWNLHSIEKIAPIDDNLLLVTNGTAQMCVQMLVSPHATFTQDDRFTAPPEGARMPREWHGAFVAQAPSTAAEFVAVLELDSDCSSKYPRASVERAGNGWKVKAGERTVTLAGDDVSVR